MGKESKNNFQIAGREIGDDKPTYFIADIAANHDADLSRAIDLVYKAKEAGADAAKFQHFQAESIVSDYGFRALGEQKSHQAKWSKSVFDVYKEASLNINWTARLKEECDKAGIVFMTSPYSFELVDAVDPYVPAYKIGSGDITWHEIIEYIAKKNKPYILASGASDFTDVQKAVAVALQHNKNLALLQCNTNYTASLDNFRYIQLNVLKSYRLMFPSMVLGLSDHTPGHATVLGAVALGARIIEKHFTDDMKRTGPDHAFSMDPQTWRDMVDRTRELEFSLGTGNKKIEDNESETAILQRRSIRLKNDIAAGEIISSENLVFLRPCPTDALPPYQTNSILGKKIRFSKKAGESIKWTDLE